MTYLFFSLMILVLILTTVSLIYLWNSNVEKKVKCACCFTLVISVVSFFCSYFRSPFEIKDEIEFIGIIIAIIAIPVSILIGWNIYSVIDFNKKNEKIQIESQKLSEKLRNESECLKKNYNELIRKIQDLDADVTFNFIMNYANDMYNKAYIPYSIDAYMDAINVALNAKWEKEKYAVALSRIGMIIKGRQDISYVYILPGMRDFYYDLLSKIEPKDDETRWIGNYILNQAKEKSVALPYSVLGFVSTFHPKRNQEETDSAV